MMMIYIEGSMFCVSVNTYSNILLIGWPHQRNFDSTDPCIKLPWLDVSVYT